MSKKTPVHEMNNIGSTPKSYQQAIEDYPRALGRCIESIVQEEDERIYLRDFYIIDSKGDDCLIISKGDSWGRMSKSGINLLRALDGLTPSEAVEALGITKNQLDHILKDPVSWGVVKLPHIHHHKSTCRTWNTDFCFLVLKLTNWCNLDCLYCYNAGNDEGESLTQEYGVEIIRNAIDFNKNGLNLVFHGGEPFIKLDLMKKLSEFAVSYAFEQGKEVCFNVQTNATLLNDEALDFIDAYHIGVGISMDGPDGLNAMRIDHTGRQTTDRVWKGIEKLRSRGHAINIITVITSHNADQLYDIIIEFQRRGITSIKFSPFLKQGHDEAAMQFMTPDPVLITTSFTRIIDGIIEGKIRNIKVDDICDMIKRCLSWGEPSMCHRAGPCGAGREMLAVYPNGDIYACDCLLHEKFRFGKFDKTKTFSEIVQGSIIDILDTCNPTQQNPCKSCALSYICCGTMTCRAFWGNGNEQSIDAGECFVNQKTLLKLLWRLTESYQLVEYFLKWENLDRVSVHQ